LVDISPSQPQNLKIPEHSDAGYVLIRVLQYFQVLTFCNQVINAHSLWYFEPITSNLSRGLHIGHSHVRQARTKKEEKRSVFPLRHEEAANEVYSLE
jgi:hypothetical protein